MHGKDPHAIALGRRGGRKGGHVRAQRLAPERRREIARLAAAARWEDRLPELLRPLFWSYRFEELRLASSLGLVLLQVLSHGNSAQRMWLRRRVGDRPIRDWLLGRQGKGLSAEAMQPWIDRATAERWISANAGATIWANR